MFGRPGYRIWCVGQVVELPTEHKETKVNFDMNSLIAQASCAEQNGGNTDVCKVKFGMLRASSCSSFW
jgi:hypothetical protein